VSWTGNRGHGTANAAAYDRDHVVTAPGKPDLSASSDPSFRGDPERWNPEELLVASLSSCHMLWFLAIAAKRGFCVDRYADSASGLLERNAERRFAMTVVTLRPAVTFSGAKLPTADELDQLHHKAHEECYIANSVKTEVRVEPVPG
jgi:organic hydroperoxide reductase OsmC/OhrA